MKKPVIFLTAFLLIVGIAFSQEKYGYIRGVVFDSEGNGIEGAEVALKGPYGPDKLVTGARGLFRFINLPEGEYEAEIKSSNCKTYIQKNIQIHIGTNVDLMIEMIAGLESETIVVESISALDIRQTSKGATIPWESLQEIPSARDPWVLMGQQPEAMQTKENVGGSESGQQSGWVARGSSKGSTMYSMDGIVITDGGGGSPAYYDYDSFQEVQITTAGNDASLQTGGTSINFVTKRGTNDFRASTHVYYTSRKLQGDNLSQELIDLGYKGDKIYMIADYGIQLGGPLFKDKVWFWAGGALQDIQKRTITDDKWDTILNCANAKLNFQLSPNDKLEFGWIFDEKIADGRGANPTHPRPTTYLQEGPARQFKVEYQRTFSDDFLISAKGSAFPSWWGLTPIGGDVQVGFDEVTGMWSRSYYRTKSSVPSYGAQLDGNWFLENRLGGDHELKFGAQWRTLPREYESGYGGDARATFRDGIPEKARVYRDRQGKYGKSRYSVYLHDTFTKGSVVLNLGIRFDREHSWVGESRIPASRTAPDLLPAIEWGGVDPDLYWNTISPRIGLTYDLFGDRKTMLHLVASRYGTTMNHGLANHLSVVNVSWAEFEWNDRNGDHFISQDELVGYPDAIIAYDGFDPANPTSLVSPNSIDPNLSSPLTNELIVGLERELMRDVYVTGNLYLRRNYNFSWTTYTGITADNWIGPYSGSTTYEGTNYNYEYWSLDQSRPAGKTLTQRPDYHENYWGLEFVLRKKLSEGWMANLSFIYQNTTQYLGETGYGVYNVSGKSAKDAQWDPTNAQFADGGTMDDVQWMTKLTFMLELPFGIRFNAFANVRQGRIFIPVINVKTPERAAVGLGSSMDLLTERFGDSRYEMFYNADFRLGKDFNVGGFGKIQLGIDLFNAFNFNHDLARYGTLNSSRYYNIEEILKPRVIRFSIRYVF